ncbi:uroporphyrinogen-III synthase [Roseibium litorale]|uniref:Uroporphyrinogen-III synthase n=1 Tax=Roseibium litorale TaxID=2803841 RepID=A0ABR9CMT0_9HYPH|nr:uroporphyrinogen-III synthase [Roseibium litorale]MBD8892023.1 uroporphyrinogen-III synthase [Roseibium litorale]
MRFLVTRPEPDCTRTAGKLKALGHEALLAPMLEFVSAVPARFDLAGVGALAVTSVRAAACLAAHPQLQALRKLPAYAVGGRTASALREAGFSMVSSADRDLEALAELIGAEVSGATVLYPAAEDRAGDLEGALAAKGLSCRVEVVYRMAPQGDLPEESIRQLKAGGVDAVLIYSGRTAEIFKDALHRAGLASLLPHMRIIGISRQSVSVFHDLALTGHAPHPTEEALLTLALSGN